MNFEKLHRTNDIISQPEKLVRKKEMERKTYRLKRGINHVPISMYGSYLAPNSNRQKHTEFMRQLEI